MCGVKKYLVVRASGGLANRLLALLGGIAFCLLSGRPLCVDWRDGMYSNDFSNVFPKWFDIHGLEHASVDAVLAEFAQGMAKGSSNIIEPPFWQAHLSEAIAVEYLFSTESHMTLEAQSKSAYDITNAAALHVDTPILVYWGYNLSVLEVLAPLLAQKFTQFPSAHVHDVARVLLNEFVVPRAEILQAVQAFYAENFTQKPLGIHVRHSDLQSPLPLMLEKLQEIYCDGDAIFLCTDNEHVEKMLQRVYPQCVVRKKNFQGVNVPLHSYLEGGDNTQKGFDALVEMFLLGECKAVINYAPSTFSRIPIFRAGLYDGHVHSIPKQKNGL